jgi:hypothetical protein
MSKVNIEVQTVLPYRLRCFEDRGLGGDTWEIAADKPIPQIPNDEVAAFILEGEVGTRVEFFNARTFSQHKTYAAAQITEPGERIVVPNMREPVPDYTITRVQGDSNIDGKVSAIRITHRRPRRA